MGKVLVVMGSDSDLPVVKKGIEILKQFSVEYEVRVISAHRTPDIAVDVSKNAKKNGFDVIITAAGKAAHLGGFMAAHTTLPVIGLPIKTSMMGGLDSLLSIVQMPNGIPVATVAVDGAVNAALLAIQMIAIKDETLSKKLEVYKENMKEEVITKDKNLDI